jgi:hypothetical protein
LVESIPSKHEGLSSKPQYHQEGKGLKRDVVEENEE